MRLDELLEHNETVRWTRKYKENERWTQFGHGSDTAQDRRHDGDTSSRSIQMWRQDRSISSRLAALNLSHYHLPPAGPGHHRASVSFFLRSVTTSPARA
jgi:hypothetical protein